MTDNSPLPEVSSSLESFLDKKYKLTTSDENFDEVLKALGVGYFKRKIANLAKPIITLTENNGEFTLSSESTFKNIYTKFKMDEQFEEMTAADYVVKTTFSKEKNKLIQVQKGDKVTTITREFTKDKVTVRVEVDNLVSVRTYTAVSSALQE